MSAEGGSHKTEQKGGEKGFVDSFFGMVKHFADVEDVTVGHNGTVDTAQKVGASGEAGLKAIGAATEVLTGGNASAESGGSGKSHSAVH